MKKVELTDEDWSKLLNSAALAPYNQVAALLQNVVQQLQKQGADCSTPQQ